jgi:hypothetical protein
MSLKWPLWISLYVVLGVLVPWATALSWAHQHGSEMRPRVRQLFQRGELGLVGLVVVISVIWNLLQSQFHAANHSLGRSPVGRDWNHGRGCVDRILLPAVDRHSVELRKNPARLQKSGVSGIHDGISG